MSLGHLTFITVQERPRSVEGHAADHVAGHGGEPRRARIKDAGSFVLHDNLGPFVGARGLPDLFDWRESLRVLQSHALALTPACYNRREHDEQETSN